MPTSHPGKERPADVNSSTDDPLRKKEQPKSTTPMVKMMKMAKSMMCS